MERLSLSAVLAATVVAATLVASATAATPTWSGHWRANPVGLFGDPTFTLKQTGSTVKGTFKWQYRAEGGFASSSCSTGYGGTIRGTVRGRKLTATMAYPARGGYPKAALILRATISQNGRDILGSGQMQSGECKGVFVTLQAKRVR
jgi:hypothetical protein